jgi:pimeloyl-ACP methyl ester carboxylesterase
VENEIPIPYLEGKVLLRDERNLAFAAYGDPKGRTVFWFHGTPGARWQIPPDAPSEAEKRGIRMIGVDRPGIGLSSHHPNRTLLSWADDIAQLVTHLGVERFGCIGLSGGGPYVLACAHQMPNQVVVGVSLGGVGPTDGAEDAPGYGRVMSTFMQMVERTRVPTGHVLSRVVRPLRPFVSPFFDLYVNFGPQEDRTVFEKPEMKKMFCHDIVMATENGIRGPVYDVSLFAKPWGFSPSDIRVPIRFWHGDADTIVPLSHSEHLAEMVPDSELRVMPGLGHFAGFVNCPEVLETMMEIWDKSEQPTEV